MSRIRASWRIIRVLGHVAAGYVTIRSRFGSASLAERQVHVQRWAAGFLAVLGVRLLVQGDPKPALNTGVLLVANHISWLDILVLLALRPVRFVSKSEVAAWPVLGYMATQCGTLYIERDKKRDALRVMHMMADALKAGDCVGVFPEGTTSDGNALLPFHANLLQAAISAHVPALPVAMAFKQPGSRRISQAANFIGDTTLVGGMWQFLQSAGMDVHLQVLPPTQANGRDRRAWALDLHAEVSTAHRQLMAP